MLWVLKYVFQALILNTFKIADLSTVSLKKVCIILVPEHPKPVPHTAKISKKRCLSLHRGVGVLFAVSLQHRKKPEISGHPACCAPSAWHCSPIFVRWVFATIAVVLQTAEGCWSHSLVTEVLLPARAMLHYNMLCVICKSWKSRRFFSLSEFIRPKNEIFFIIQSSPCFIILYSSETNVFFYLYQHKMNMPHWAKTEKLMLVRFFLENG